MSPLTANQQWAALLLDFEATTPNEPRRHAFGMACQETSHLKVARRVPLLRARFGLAGGAA